MVVCGECNDNDDDSFSAALSVAQDRQDRQLYNIPL